jgi:hypothetical protein
VPKEQQAFRAKELPKGMEAAKNKIGNKAENCIVGFSPEDFIYMHI